MLCALVIFGVLGYGALSSGLKLLKTTSSHIHADEVLIIPFVIVDARIRDAGKIGYKRHKSTFSSRSHLIDIPGFCSLLLMNLTDIEI